jgi:hypothetical protein
MPKRRVGDDAHDETVAGITPGAGGAETEIVAVDYPPTGSETLEAWSAEEPEIELDGSWRSALSRAAVPLFITALVAFGAVVAGWLMIEVHREDAGPRESVRPTVAAATPVAALPPSVVAPTAKTIDDDEFVAMAISPGAITTNRQNGAGFGTSGTQDRADRIALSECRAISGDDDCLLVNAGKFHGCVAYAITTYGDVKKWAGGSGNDAAQASAVAVGRLGAPGSAVVQCSDPPGIIKASSTPQAAPTHTTTSAPPKNVTVTAADEDRSYLAALEQSGVTITDPVQAAAGGRSVCAYLKQGHSEAEAVAVGMRNNPSLSPMEAVHAITLAVVAYCPEMNRTR